ncbi:hypothetical protein ABT246_11995 [Streptomyces sp. NPDC001553]|uniref:hypothetical protein n=1 Tax=Streptomyces sp. NPDC001553 TaxID=3154385 RepID=UPI003317A235
MAPHQLPCLPSLRRRQPRHAPPGPARPARTPEPAPRPPSDLCIASGRLIPANSDLLLPMFEDAEPDPADDKLALF